VLSRRGLFKGLLGVAAAPTLAKLLPTPVLEEVAPVIPSKRMLDLSNANYILKTLYPQERIERFVYEDSPLLALCPTDHS
jgi:hypothetical protein